MSKLDISPLVKLTEQAAWGPGSHFWKLRPQLAEQYDVPALMEYGFCSEQGGLNDMTNHFANADRSRHTRV